MRSDTEAALDMLSRQLNLILRAALLVASLALPAVAGTDVTLLDASGSALKPALIDKVSITRSCGDCHDVKANAQSVHFNRTSPNADPDSTDCLACHIPTKDAFSADGTVKAMTSTVDDGACLGCHADLGLSAGHPGRSHDGMACIDCHKNAGHKKTGAASCRGCHFEGKTGATPAHVGLPGLHLKRLACETCHITRTPSGGRPGYVRKGGKIWPVDENGALIHHVVDGKAGCRGSAGCKDCHSAGSAFFNGTTTIQGADGNTVKLPNWKSMGLKHRDVQIGVIRESFIKRYGGWLFLLVLGAAVLHYLIFGPHRVHVTDDDPEVQRFTLFERLVHWLAMLFWAFLSISGILFFMHGESGAGALRHLHGQIGAAFVLVLIALVMTWWRHAVFAKCDREWVCKLGGYLWIRADCPAGKFNAGQKAFFWIVAVLGGLVISGTGVWLMVGHGSAPAWVYTLHDLAAIALIAGIIGHVYLGVFANPGTIMSILSGRVKRSWAEKHHSEWAKKL